MLRFVLLLALLAPAAAGQVRYPGQSGGGLPVPSAPGAAPDTASGPRIELPIPPAPPAEGGLERPVQYTARDSLRVVLAGRDSTGPGDVVSLFGAVRAEVEGATITAGRVDYEASSEVLRAQPTASDSGETDVPQFAGEEGQFSGRTVVYNLRTQRGRVTGARTAIEDGYLLGGILKQQDAHVVFAQDAAYTTCELDHPHYALEAGRIKVVDGERVYTGPVRLRLLGIPMPLVLPFGYFPAAEGRRSGPLAVDYGQETNWGLYLANLGWYWAVSDRFDAQVSGRVGTQGSFQLRSRVRYNRRYAYNGDVELTYGRLRSGEPTDPTFSLRTPAGLRWGHNQTFPAGQRLTASVNLQTASQRLVSADVADQIQSSTSSSVAYGQNWNTVGRSLNVSAQVFQDFANDRTTATLPQLSFSQQRRFPFRRGRDDRWWEKVSVQYSANAQNAFAFSPRDDSTGVSALDALFSPSQFREAVCPVGEPDCDERAFSYQVVQRVPVSAAFSVPRFNLTLSPSVNVTETWADSERVRAYDPALGRAVDSQEAGFTAVRQVAVSAAASTEFFGTFPVRVGSLDGVRHTVSPQLSLSYQPDYAAFGFVREVQVDAQGNTQRYAVHPSIPTTSTRTLGLSVGNAFVARTVRTDSTGEETRTTRQVLAVNVSTGYNFGDLRTPLDPVAASFTTDLFGVSASGGAVFDAYAPDTSLTRSPLTYFDVGGRPLRLTSASLRLNRSFRSATRTGRRDERPVFAAPLPGEPYDPGAFGPTRAPVGYVDYSAPWSFSLGLTLNQSAGFDGTPNTTATLELNQLTARLTPNWSLTGSSGLDLTTLDVTQTRVGLRRDLHCWEMAVNWQPIGRTRLFSVSLYLKAGLLRDFLRLDVPNSTVRPSAFSGRPF